MFEWKDSKIRNRLHAVMVIFHVLAQCWVCWILLFLLYAMLTSRLLAEQTVSV
jgi:hypothetical protein